MAVGRRLWAVVRNLQSTAYSPQPIAAAEGRVLELSHESTSFGQEDLQELQDRASSAHCICHLLGRPPQAASGLMIQVDG